MQAAGMVPMPVNNNLILYLWQDGSLVIVCTGFNERGL